MTVDGVLCVEQSTVGCSIFLTLFADVEYEYEPASRHCPGGESCWVERLRELEVEVEYGDPEHYLLFSLHDERQIVDFLLAWGVDAYDCCLGWEFTHDDGPDEPDPDRLRDEWLEQREDWDP